MRLTGFCIQMYRSIIDSGWIDLADLTVIVGKNESGKTSLLRALHKFHPFKPDPYVIQREWPRGHRREQNDRQVVCTVRFGLAKDDLAALSEIAGHGFSTNTVEVSRDYGGRFEVHFSDGLFPDMLHPNEVDNLSEALPSVPDSVGAEYRASAELCRETARRTAREGRYSDLSALAAEHTAALGQNLSSQNPQRQNEDAFRNQFIAKLQELSQKLPTLPTLHARAHEYVVKKMPTFIYMDDYRAFTGTARLDEVKKRKDESRSTDEDKTLLTIMELAGLDLSKEIQQSQTIDREQRQYDLDDASKTLTRDIADRWKQKKYEVQFRADGTQFFTMVQDDPNVGLIRLEERSKGFQWFFSFDLMFMYESRGSFEGCVLLLDEPGLHLHPDGQTDLLARLEEYAKKNLLIYTTHLPFMIDLRTPDRIKVINDTPTGARVSDNLMDSPPEAKFTLQAALGMSGRTSYLVAQQNLVVEGPDDFWVLTELSRLLGSSGQACLPEDLYVTSAGGAAEAGYIATFMIGQKLDVVVLLDSDKAGDDAKEKLVKRWITRYQGQPTQVLSLADAVGITTSDYAIEDLFPEAYYLESVHEAYARELSAASATVTLTGGGQICKRVERAMSAIGIPFNKGRVAKLLRNRLARMKSADEIPPDTRTTAVRLFEAIRAALPKH